MKINKSRLFLAVFSLATAHASQPLYRSVRTLSSQPGVMQALSSRAYSSARKAPVDIVQARQVAQTALKNPTDLVALARATKELSRKAALSRSNDDYIPSEDTANLSKLWAKLYLTQAAMPAWLAQRKAQDDALLSSPKALKDYFSGKPGIINKALSFSVVPDSVRKMFYRPVPSAQELESITDITNLPEVLYRHQRNLDDLRAAEDVFKNEYDHSKKTDELLSRGFDEKSYPLLKSSNDLRHVASATQEQLKNEALGVAPAHIEADVAWAEDVLNRTKSLDSAGKIHEADLDEVTRAEEAARLASELAEGKDIRAGVPTGFFDKPSYERKRRRDLWLDLNKLQNKIEETLPAEPVKSWDL